jgi:hypothetical protein
MITDDQHESAGSGRAYFAWLADAAGHKSAHAGADGVRVWCGQSWSSLMAWQADLMLAGW